MFVDVEKDIILPRIDAIGTRVQKSAVFPVLARSTNVPVAAHALSVNVAISNKCPGRARPAPGQRSCWRHGVTGPFALALLLLLSLLNNFLYLLPLDLLHLGAQFTVRNKQIGRNRLATAGTREVARDQLLAHALVAVARVATRHLKPLYQHRLVATPKHPPDTALTRTEEQSEHMNRGGKSTSCSTSSASARSLNPPSIMRTLANPPPGSTTEPSVKSPSSTVSRKARGIPVALVMKH